MFSLVPEIETLRDDGVLGGSTAAALLERERREVVSVYGELRLLTWGGVMLITGGVGVIVSKNLDRIGPLMVAFAIGAASAACYGWAFWKRTRTASLVDDYILLLASLLLSADVGYVEHQYHLLGASWQRHLLLLAVVHAVVAYVFGSRMVLSLSLTALAAWMGLERRVEAIFDSSADTAARALVFAGVVLVWRLIDERVTHNRRFTALFEHFAANVAFGGALALTFASDTRWTGCAIAVILAALVAWHGLRTKKEAFVLYAWLYGVVAVDIAICSVLHDEVLVALYLVASTVAAIIGLFVIHSRLAEAE